MPLSVLAVTRFALTGCSSALYRGAKNASYVAYALDNRNPLSVGGFPTATAAGTDLASVARASGIPQVMEAGRVAELTAAMSKALAGRTIMTIVAGVEAVALKSFHMDLTLLENRFQLWPHLQSRRRA